MSYSNLKQLVLETAKKAYHNGLVAGTSGNFSVRVPESRMVVITPSNHDYEQMKQEDIVVIDLEGNIIEGTSKPSSEWRMHAAIYETIADAHAVVHTHSPYASSFSVINEKIPVVLIEMIAIGGDVPVAPFAMTGTKELGINVANTLQECKRYACLLENHGALTVGSTLAKAYKRAIYLEDAAKIYHLARCIGRPQLIADSEIQDAMKRIGITY